MSLTSLVLFRSLVPVALAVASPAQIQVTWSTFGGGGPGTSELVSASAVDGAGALFVAGTRDVDPSAGFSLDAVLTKFDGQGAVEWERTYDEPTGGSQSFGFVGVDASGHAVVAGPNHAGTAAIVARYDTSGNRLWLRELTGPAGEASSIEALQVAPSGDVVLCGSVLPPSAFATDAFVARIRSDGTTAWTYVYTASPAGGDSATAVVLDAAGNAYVAGLAETNGLESGLFALKLGLDGTLAWGTFLSPVTGNHQGLRAAVDAQGRLYVADTLSVNGIHSLDLVQFDANGAHAWDRQVLSPNGVQVGGVAVREDGTVLVGASLRGTSAASARAYVGAWDATGTQLWSATYDAPGSQFEPVTDFDLDPTGGALLTGPHSAGFNATGVFVAHVTDAGQQDWSQVLGAANTIEASPQLHVSLDDSLRVCSRWQSAFANDARTRVRRLEHDVTAFCSGDGSATACPCGNSGGLRSGCASSIGVGAVLRGYGSASVAFDTLYLQGTDLPPTTATFFQGTQRVAGGAGVVFGDGLRCAGGSVVRLGTLAVPLGNTTFPSAGQALSLIGNVTAPGLRTYQCWYRNSANFCTPETFNLSNGLAVLWRP